MSILYKDEKDQTLSVEIIQKDGKIEMEFTKDCGKFGMDEGIDFYRLTPERLLQILQDREDYTDEEL
jgi:hypothetical protein